ncbi:hypothetical protein BCON_0442g00010 [Botryotinia convoluta]|uniref:Uncharacterized protein n=1 Tax=Botryotinia convoluta TaxID=54673 RepID=A0A4Z1H8B4_9HELO|nr:hypothetical protein BCON_0442g00010 [Botryotinia convoluta]
MLDNDAAAVTRLKLQTNNALNFQVNFSKSAVLKLVRYPISTLKECQGKLLIQSIDFETSPADLSPVPSADIVLLTFLCLGQAAASFYRGPVFLLVYGSKTVACFRDLIW